MMVKVYELNEVLAFNNTQHIGEKCCVTIDHKNYFFIKGFLGYIPRMFQNKLYDVKVRQSAAYLIREKSEGSVYVGSAGNVYSRIVKHKHFIAIKKHANFNFTKLLEEKSIVDFELIVVFTDNREEAYKVEQIFLDLFANDVNLLNIASDARTARLGTTITDEHRKVISLANKNKIVSVQTKERLSNFHKTDEKAIKQFSHVLMDKRRRLMVDGVEYESMTDAGNRSKFSHSHIRKVIRTKSDPGIYFLSENESPLRGKLLSDERKQRMSDFKKNDPKSITQFNSIRELVKKKIVFNGKEYESVTAASLDNNVPLCIIYRHLKKHNNVSTGESYSLNYVKPSLKKVTVDGTTYDSLATAAKLLSINKNTLKTRIRASNKLRT